MGELLELFDSGRKRLRADGNKLVHPCVEPFERSRRTPVRRIGVEPKNTPYQPI